MTIVGVARNSHYSAVKEDASPVYYAPWRQDKQLGDLTFYLRRHCRWIKPWRRRAA